MLSRLEVSGSLYNNFKLTSKHLDSYDIAPLSEEFTRVTVKAEDGEYNALKDVNAYTYNGFFLPPLPAWDTAAYPYAIVYYAPRNAGVTAYFGYSDQPFYMDTTGGLVTNTPGATVYASMYDAEVCEDASTFVWQVPKLFPDAALALVPGMVVWTNVNLLDDIGAVFLHWSRAEKATYKRYRYNDLIAPPIPEDLDMGKYPYLHLIGGEDTAVAGEGSKWINLIATDAPGYFRMGEDGNLELFCPGPDPDVIGDVVNYCIYAAASDQIAAAIWEDKGMGAIFSSQKWSEPVSGSYVNGYTINGPFFFWSNYDLKFDDEEKTEYLKASEPAVEYLDLPYGRTLQVDIPWGTQRNADIILSTISDYRYQPFTASKVYLDPAAELGDGVTIGGVTAVLCAQDISFGSLTAANISAPDDEELNHEYTYKTKQERTAARQSAAIRKTEAVTTGQETAQRLKTQEFYVGGQKYAPMTITYTDSSGNPATMTVLGLVT